MGHYGHAGAARLGTPRRPIQSRIEYILDRRGTSRHLVGLAHLGSDQPMDATLGCSQADGVWIWSRLVSDAGLRRSISRVSRAGALLGQSEARVRILSCR